MSHMTSAIFSIFDPLSEIYILKLRLQTYENQQNEAMDEVITESEIIHKFTQDVHRKLTMPAKAYQFKPLDTYNPPSCPHLP